MTKIYLVTRVYNENGVETAKVADVFTNHKKEMALARWYKAVDEVDKKKYPNMMERLRPKTLIDTRRINDFDYTNAAIEKEMELLPF